MLRISSKRAFSLGVMTVATFVSLAASSMAAAPNLRNKYMDLRFTSNPAVIGANISVAWNAPYSTSASGVVTTQGTMRYLPGGTAFTVNITMAPQNEATGYLITITPANALLGTSYSGSIKAEAGGAIFLAGSGTKRYFKYVYPIGYVVATAGPIPFWGNGWDIPW